MPDLGTQDNWVILTDFVKTHKIDRFSWSINDGNHRFQFIFTQLQPLTPGQKCAELYIIEQNAKRPWSQTIDILCSRKKWLYPGNAREFNENGLKNALNIKPNRDTDNRWSTKEWIMGAFKHLTQPGVVSRPLPHQLPPNIHKRIVEEKNKIYFLYMRHTGHPSANNLEKTRLLIGEHAYMFARTYGYSSHWSDNPKDFSDKEWNDWINTISGNTISCGNGSS
ncbi:DUF6037 family protein [Actinotignum urinale]|uniref:DUF6037 family protein n=1 Tax=Actinotignum urinale TaxID=190146 RepID=A0ABU5G676_9ACTO|nr:DUF6037 family protein [Actinotignum urinale]MDY5132861.1 DUF6037 family protein [Actinotignum urinale]